MSYRVYIHSNKDIKDFYTEDTQLFFETKLKPFLKSRYGSEENFSENIKIAKYKCYNAIAFKFYDIFIRFENNSEEETSQEQDIPQEQQLVQMYIEKKKTDFALTQTNSITMVAPYTILISESKIKENPYFWLAYSIGRPTNMIWGQVNEENQATIQRGCHYNSFGILNDMLYSKKADGYIICGTIARDQIKSTILKFLIIGSYERGENLITDEFFLTSSEIQRGILKHLEDVVETKKTLDKAAESFAKELVKESNIVQYLTEKIPKKVVDAITTLIERTPILLEALSIKCPTKKQCLDDYYVNECDLYFSDPVL